MKTGMNHKGTAMLRTSRLLLRRFAPGDEEAMFRNWTSDPAVSKFMRWTAHQSPAEDRELLENILSQYSRPDFYRWAIVPEDVGEPVGVISLMEVCESDLCYETAYCIGRLWQGQGYVAEALHAVLDFAFRQVGINRVEAYHSVKNPGSGRVMVKAGMLKEGFSPQKYRCSLGFQDCDLYGITRDAWLNRQANQSF
ncbi:MAG: GNAT family N-acetyltransferase [Candidatus Merdivicinus sp.]|jgi:ribosomal-protein-alanine N-acetyltransferase